MNEAPMNNDMILGEMRGQLREVVHTLNGQSMKMDALAREVIALGPLAADIAEIKSRLSKLESNDNQHTGGMAVLRIILTSPVVLSLLVAAAAVWLTLSGKVHIS